MNPQAVEREQQLLACLDEVMDASPSERTALVRSKLGDDPSLLRDLERLLIAVEQPDKTYLPESVDGFLQPVLKDLAEHSDTAGDVPTALVTALAPRYTIQERIGRGGMASVYLGFDTTLGRHVAIKSLRPELADSISLERFQREIAIAATIDHPCVVSVYDRGSAGGLLYYIMPYIGGGSLRDLLLERPQLEIRKAIDIARSVAEALDAAHARKIVHRDIKPANILLDEHRAYVADFGVARLVDVAGREQLTRTGVALGTALYMSPEQVSSPTKVDGRCDVYALGCVLYEMLAGEAPFTGPTQREIMAKHLAAATPDLTVVRPTVTRAMQQVIAIALQKAPADRFATAGEFIDAFERAWVAPNDSDDVTGDVRATHVPDHVRSSARLRVASVLTLGAVVAAAALAIPLSRWIAGSNDAVGGVPEGDPRRVAVLYFDVGSPTTIPSYVADGITESVIDALSSVRALHVLSPTAVRRFRGAPFSHDSVRQALKAGTIVSGSIARSGDEVRVNVRLTDAVSGQQLSNELVSTGWTERFALENKVADRVAFALRQRIGAEIDLRERRRGTTSLAAWNAAQQADEVMRRLQGDLPPPSAARGEMLWGWWRQADSLYIVARALDRRWSYPVLRRGQMALRLWLVEDPPLGWQDSVLTSTMSAADKKLHWLRRSIDLASEALRIDSKSSDALALRGEARYVLMSGRSGHDTLAGLIDRDLQAAVSLRPENASAWRTRALFLSGQARFSEAVSAADRAFLSDPFLQQSSVISTAFWAALWAEHFEDARKWCRLGRDHYPNFPTLILFAECDLTLLGWTGSGRDVALAWQMVDSIERVPSPVAQSLLRSTWGYRRLLVAAILARAEMRDSALAVLRRVHAVPPAERGLTTTPEAHVYALLGERDSAVARLAKLLEAAPQRRTFFLGLPWARSLRDDPRLATGVGSSRPPGSSP